MEAYFPNEKNLPVGIVTPGGLELFGCGSLPAGLEAILKCDVPPVVYL